MAVCSMACAGEEQLCLPLTAVYFTQLTISLWTDVELPDKVFQTTYSDSDYNVPLFLVIYRFSRRRKSQMCFIVRFTLI